MSSFKLSVGNVNTYYAFEACEYMGVMLQAREDRDVCQLGSNNP